MFKLNFDLLIPFPRSDGGGVGWGGACRQNICYQFAAFLILFNLICSEKLNFDLLTRSTGSGGERGKGACGQNICYHVAAFHDSL